MKDFEKVAPTVESLVEPLDVSLALQMAALLVDLRDMSLAVQLVELKAGHSVGHLVVHLVYKLVEVQVVVRDDLRAGK